MSVNTTTTAARDLSLVVGSGGASQAVSISTTSAQSAAITTGTAVIYSTVECFVRAGSNPTAVSDGTDMYIPASTLLRIAVTTPGNKLAFKTASGTGTVYITPGS